MAESETALTVIDERLQKLIQRKRLRRMAKRVRKSARAGRDCEAAKRAARFIDGLPDDGLDHEAATKLAVQLQDLQAQIAGMAEAADPDAVWLKCRRDYGRVRGLGSAWRDGEARIDYCEWERALTGVYTQLCVLAPRRMLDHETWEALIRMVGDRAALGALRRQLSFSAPRISPAYVVPRTVALIDDLGERLEPRIAEAHAACFEARPRSYFAHLRHG
jgi:hypothetical protein